MRVYLRVVNKENLRHRRVDLDIEKFRFANLQGIQLQRLVFKSKVVV